MHVELALERSRATRRKAKAWLLAGDEVASWIAELERFGLPLSQLRLLALPDGAGLLVVPPEGTRPHGTLAGLPYACIADRLYLPIDAVLSPPLSDGELRLLLGQATHVFHPRAGLVACEPGAELRVEQLLIPPVRVHADWSGARPGPPPWPPLTRIELAEPPKHPLPRDAGGDIGSLRGEELPEAPGELSDSALARARRATTRRLGEWMIQASMLAPSGASLPRWLDPLRARFKNLARGWTEPERSARQRELERLAHLLDTDPDRGLRHAVPLGNRHERDAGLVPDPPLPDRDPDLDLARAAFGQPVSPLEVDPDLYARLQALYRAAAERELRLGRFRRAAFVYLELLDDGASAAGALLRGSFWREAAAVHRDHLGQPLAAAECLEEGGLLADALALYEAHDAHERAARLYRRLDDEPRARAAFRRAVDAELARGEVLEAARMLERELGLEDEALDVLAGAWPRGRRAGDALRARFALMQRLGRAPELRALVPRLVEEQNPDDARLAVELADALAELARRATEPALAEAVEDATRIVAARALPAAGLASAARLMRAVAAGAPDDGLLALDVDRWLDRQRGARTRPATGGVVRLVHEFEFGGGLRVHRAAASRAGLAVLATSAAGPQERTVLIECEFDGTDQQLTPIDLDSGKGELLLSTDTGGATLVGARRGALWLRGSDLAPFRRLEWAPNDVLAAELQRDRITLLRHEAGTDAVVLGRYTQDGGLLNVRLVASARSFKALEPAELVHDRDTCVIALGRTLARLDPGEPTRAELGSEVLGLAAPRLPQASHVVACLARGAALFPALGSRLYPIPLARDLASPIAAFALSGRLVLASERELRVYVIDGRDARVVARLELEARPLCGVLPAGGPYRVALVDVAGGVRVFELPRA